MTAGGAVPDPGAGGGRGGGGRPRNGPGAGRAGGGSERRSDPGLVCELCGGAVLDRHCKIVCLNCGFQRDCSDP